MTTLTAAKAQKSFTETLDRVSIGRERIIVKRDGKELAAIIPVEDLKLLERLLEEVEDRGLAELALLRERQAESVGEKPIPWKKARKDLGL